MVALGTRLDPPREDGIVDDALRRRYADYLARELRGLLIPPPVPEGRPRPGFGVIYVLAGSPPGQLPRDDGWVARWVDEYGNPGVHGEVVGIDTVEGSRAAVLAWARAQPAEARLMPVETAEGWVPLPDDDADVVP